MKWMKRILLALLIVLILIQFIRPEKNNSDQLSITHMTNTFYVPVSAQNILQAACYDCHSNKTNYPWYSNVQPFGWLLAKHIRQGKEELNFSEFGSYSLRRQISKLNSIAKSVENGSMPLTSYTMMHKNARLSKNDKQLIIDWATKKKDSLRLRN